MQVATQEKNTVVAQSRGYWGYEEIDSGKMEKIAGAGDGGDGGGCGCGCGDGDGGDGGDCGNCGDEGFAEALANCFSDEASAFACVIGGPPSGGPGLPSVNDGFDAMGNQTGQ
jgi:hypothetical protein